jgi:tetratricopeptide (TPR) repeat protein
MTQNNLGNALSAQGIRTSGEEGARLLAEAVAAYRQALQVYTREQLPQDWAMTQNNLGNALSEQGIRTSGEEGARLLAEAVAVHRQALQVRTREQLPQ